MANEYGSLTLLKRMRRIEHDEDDELLQFHHEAGSRRIDERCDRRFYADADASARVYELDGRTIWERGKPGELLLIDDFYSTQDLVVEVGDGLTTWTTVDASLYLPDPAEAPAKGWPYEALRRLRSSWSFGAWSATHARVTARWGWETVPPAIADATLLLSSRLYLRKDSPEGTAGSPEWGVMQLARLDPDVEDLIEPFLKHDGGFG